jgi:hypothetical protein
LGTYSVLACATAGAPATTTAHANGAISPRTPRIIAISSSHSRPLRRRPRPGHSTRPGVGVRAGPRSRRPAGRRISHKAIRIGTAVARLASSSHGARATSRPAGGPRRGRRVGRAGAEPCRAATSFASALWSR